MRRAAWTGRSAKRAGAGRPGAGEAGVSYTELIVVFFLLSIIGLMAYDLLVGTAQTNLYLESNNDLSEYGQRLVNQMKTEVLQSKRLLDNTAAGNGYLAALELAAAPTPIDSTILPKIETNGSFSPSLAGDAERPFVAASVGNSLFFAEALTPYLDEALEARIDLYRFIYYYLGKNYDRGIAGQDHILEIYRWESVQFADYNQLLRLTFRDDGGATLAAVLGALESADPGTGRPAITVAWNPDADADEAFYPFEGASTLPPSPDAAQEVEMATIGPAIPQLSGPRIGGKMPYSVAFNSAADFDIGNPVPLFAPASATGDGFPNGLETMMVGPTGGRQVFVRLVLAADSDSARLVSRENVVLISARDY